MQENTVKNEYNQLINKKEKQYHTKSYEKLSIKESRRNKQNEKKMVA